MDPKSVSPKQLFFEVLRSVVLLIEWFFSFWPIVLHSDPNKKVKKMWELWLLWSDDWCDTLNLEQSDIFVYFTTFLSSTCNSVLSNQFQFFISASFAPAHCLKVTLKSLVKILNWSFTPKMTSKLKMKMAIFRYVEKWDFFVIFKHCDLCSSLSGPCHLINASLIQIVHKGVQGVSWLTVQKTQWFDY